MPHYIERYREAIREARQYGRTRPRRWIAKHGAIVPMQDRETAQLRREYRQIREEIEALVPVVRVGSE